LILYWKLGREKTYLFQKIEGIIIRTTNYGETNKIITIYSRESGKVGVMARGAKKPKSRLSSISQLFTYGYYFVQQSSGLGTLQQGEVIQSMRKLREDIMLTAHAAYIAELTDKLTDDKKTNPYLFELLYQTLHYMNEGLDLDILRSIYEIKMLHVAGILPKINGCANCQKQEGHFLFSIREGGFLCEACRSIDPYAFVIAASTVKLLRLFYFMDLKRLGTISVKEGTKQELKHVIERYYDEYSGLSLKSKRFLDQFQNLYKKDEG
jgi:DNA repair protein RecO (recombination protein O)